MSNHKRKPTLWPSPEWNFVFRPSVLTPQGDKTLDLQGICAGSPGVKGHPLTGPCSSFGELSGSLSTIDRSTPTTAACLPYSYHGFCQTGLLLPNPAGLSHHLHVFSTILSLSYLSPFNSLVLAAVLTLTSGIRHHLLLTWRGFCEFALGTSSRAIKSPINVGFCAYEINSG